MEIHLAKDNGVWTERSEFHAKVNYQLEPKILVMNLIQLDFVGKMKYCTSQIELLRYVCDETSFSQPTHINQSVSIYQLVLINGSTG